MTTTVTVRSEIANRIREKRKELGKSIETLADEAKMSFGYLSEVERGKSAASGELLARIAANLNVTIDYLMTGRNETKVATPIMIPVALSQLASEYKLSYDQTLRLLAGKNSVVAHRTSGEIREWNKQDWQKFYEVVKKHF